MFLKYFYDEALAHASYLVGCQRTGEAIVIDPSRNIREYLETAQAQDMKIVAAAETHIHADFVSGSRELEARCGARLHLSKAGPKEWQYGFADPGKHVLLAEGTNFQIGGIRFDVIHTPGHTPESISLLLTDRGGGAKVPMGVFTGDFVFVGAIGRPDLLEEAVGVEGSAEREARVLFQSLQRFKQQPDYLQVWPAHGAGSACGKGLGAIPSSTVGYEKLHNPAFQIEDENDFVEYILADQPKAPPYFARMKQVNRDGPNVLGAQEPPQPLTRQDVQDRFSTCRLVDTRIPVEFRGGLLKSSMNIPESMLAPWAANLVDPNESLILISRPEQIEKERSILNSIGIENLTGFIDENELNATEELEQHEAIVPISLASKMPSQTLQLIDVRENSEWELGHIEGATHIPLSELSSRLDELDRHRKIVFQCRSGARSSIALGLASEAGFTRLLNLEGGIEQWQASGLPLVTERENTGSSLPGGA